MSDPSTQLELDIASAKAQYGEAITALASELHRRVSTLPMVKCRILAVLYLLQATADSDGLTRDFLAGLVEDPLDVHPGQLAQQDRITGAHDQPYRLTESGRELILPCAGVLIGEPESEDGVKDDALAMAHAEIDKLREELDIFKERVSGEKAILLRIRTAESKVESAKMALSSEKERLSQAHDELAAFIAQEPGKQLEIFSEQKADDGTPTWFEQGAASFSQGRHLDTCSLPLGNDRIAWERGWRSARIGACQGGQIESAVLAGEASEVECLGDELPVGEKPQADPPTVEHLDRHWLVYRPLETARNAKRYPLLQLFTKDEWQQLHADAYGNPVSGFDQDDGARDRRQRGGIDCGRLVKIGRKSLVVGPLSDACFVEKASEERDEQ